MSGRLFLAVILWGAAAALPAGAETLDTQPLFDVTATRWTGEPWLLIGTGGTVTAELAISNQPENPSFEARGVFEFDIQSIPPGASIESAMLNLDVTSFAQDGEPPFLEFYGYVGNGSADVEDPNNTAESQRIGTYSPITALGPITVPLAPGYIESIAHEAFLGIVMWQGADKASTSVSSLENPTSGTAAMLSITFSGAVVPEPSSLAALWGMAVAAAAIMHRRRKRGRAA